MKSYFHTSSQKLQTNFAYTIRANASKIMKKLDEKRVIESGLEALELETEFGGVTLEQIEGKMAQNGKVFSTIDTPRGE